MEQLEVADGFDVHEHRHGLKLVKQERETMHLENKDGQFACPACGRAFDQLFVTEKRATTFGKPDSPFCLVRTTEELLLLTH